MRGFRVYDTTEKKYVTNELGWVVTPSGELYELDCGDLIGRPDCVKEDDTGLTDKNGKKIFERDILKVTTGNAEKNGSGIVEWIQCGCNFVVKGFKNKPYVDQYHKREKGEFYRQLQEWLVTEIIGNIHDNKELLEENK